MTDSLRDDVRRLTDLLADRATGDLAESDRAELDRLLSQVPGADEIAASYDRLEGGLTLAMHETPEPLPAALRTNLAEQGRAMVAAQASIANAGTATKEAGPFPVERARGPQAAMGPARSGAWDSLGAKLGWLVAAAAVALAAVAWWPKGPGDLPPTLAEQRAALGREDAGSITLVLDAAGDPAGQGVVADVVWSTSLQRGYLRVRGLAVNDPAQQQYQFWITDGTRDDAHPVSAAVFDVSPASIDPITRDVIIALSPGLPIGDARAFALTIERPGGVVVSDRSRVVVAGLVG